MHRLICVFILFILTIRANTMNSINIVNTSESTFKSSYG